MVESTNRDALLRGYGELFEQLLASERFTSLVAMYFTISKIVDESTKTVLFQVVENPPEVIAKKMLELSKDKKPLVEVFSKSKAKRIVEQAKKPRKRK